MKFMIKHDEIYEVRKVRRKEYDAVRKYNVSMK